MVARYSDAMKLQHAKAIASENGLFIIERFETAYVNGKSSFQRAYWLLYREAIPRNVYVGRRSSIDDLLSFVRKATGSK